MLIFLRWPAWGASQDLEGGLREGLDFGEDPYGSIGEHSICPALNEIRRWRLFALYSPC